MKLLTSAGILYVRGYYVELQKLVNSRHDSLKTHFPELNGNKLFILWLVNTKSFERVVQQNTDYYGREKLRKKFFDFKDLVNTNPRTLNPEYFLQLMRSLKY
jgi:hypothetical protein